MTRKIRVDKTKLDRMMAARGFANYKEAWEAARERGLVLSWRTIYSMVDGGNWRRDSLEALCRLLDCKPADILVGWELKRPHGSPQPIEEPQVA